MLKPENVRHLYTAIDPVHGFDHIKRVHALAMRIAKEEGADEEIVNAAALLHDLKATPHIEDQSIRGKHHEVAATLAEKILLKEGWKKDRIDEVKHCILAHRYRDKGNKPETIEAKVLFDADKLDAIGATGVARAIGYAVQVNQSLYQQPSEAFLLTGEKIEGEHHTPYHEYLYKLQYLKDNLYTASARNIAEIRHKMMKMYFEQLIAEQRGER